MRRGVKPGNAAPKRVTAAWWDSAKFASEYACGLVVVDHELGLGDALHHGACIS